MKARIHALVLVLCATLCTTAPIRSKRGILDQFGLDGDDAAAVEGLAGDGALDSLLGGLGGNDAGTSDQGGIFDKLPINLGAIPGLGALAARSNPSDSFLDSLNLEDTAALLDAAGGAGNLDTLLQDITARAINSRAISHGVARKIKRDMAASKLIAKALRS